MAVSDLFTTEQKAQITDAIKEAELNTSGEIRVHIEKSCKIEVLERASQVFSKLQMQKTELRNGVLFYLAMNDRKFAILGDAGINAKVPEGFWDNISETVVSEFKNSKYSNGLAKGILMAGTKLKEHFPHQQDDVNELSDEISFGN